MLIRKALYWWLFPAAVILPVWLIVGWAAFSAGSGWTLLGLLILCPVLFVVLLAVGGILVARRSVREARAVSWLDAGLVTAWHAAIIAFGFFPAGASGWIAVLAILLFLAVFWVGLWELVTELRLRVQQTFEAYERIAQPPSEPGRPRADYGEGADVIIVEERREEP